MKKIVVVADDFGFTKGVNDGCLEALENGILTDLSFMVDSFGSEDAVKRVKERRVVDHIGIHVTLNDLVGTGIYLRSSDYEELLANENASKLQKRVREEFRKFEDAFEAYPTHVNSHKNIHQHEKLREVFAQYTAENDIYIRRTERFNDTNIVHEKKPLSANEYFRENGCKLTDYIFEEITSPYQEAFDGFLKKLSQVENDTTTEVFFHPAYVDKQMKLYTSMIEDRERDLKLLTSSAFKEEIEGLRFVITQFVTL